MYTVGQTVFFTSAIDRPGSEGMYTIVSYLPLEGDEHRYRIKRENEPFERVARESQLAMLAH
jgi:hypothetical protein